MVKSKSGHVISGRPVNGLRHKLLKRSGAAAFMLFWPAIAVVVVVKENWDEIKGVYRDSFSTAFLPWEEHDARD